MDTPVVTIKLTPREFDLLREAVREAEQTAMRNATPNRSTDPKDRQEHRLRASQLHDLGDNLGV